MSLYSLDYNPFAYVFYWPSPFPSSCCPPFKFSYTLQPRSLKCIIHNHAFDIFQSKPEASSAPAKPTSNGVSSGAQNSTATTTQKSNPTGTAGSQPAPKRKTPKEKMQNLTKVCSLLQYCCYKLFFFTLFYTLYSKYLFFKERFLFDNLDLLTKNLKI